MSLIPEVDVYLGKSITAFLDERARYKLHYTALDCLECFNELKGRLHELVDEKMKRVQLKMDWENNINESLIESEL